MDRVFNPIETEINVRGNGGMDFARNVDETELFVSFCNDEDGEKLKDYVQSNKECPLHESHGMCKMVDDIPYAPGSQGILRGVKEYEVFFVCNSPEDKQTLEKWVTDNWQSVVNS